MEDSRIKRNRLNGRASPVEATNQNARKGKG
jgi:hypothetical protein